MSDTLKRMKRALEVEANISAMRYNTVIEFFTAWSFDFGEVPIFEYGPYAHGVVLSYDDMHVLLLVDGDLQIIDRVDI